MKIQQHDGVVVEATVISAGLRQAHGEGGVAREGEGGARGCGAAALPPPSIYRGPGGAPALEIRSKGGAAAKWGGRGALPPKARGNSPLGFPTLGAWGEAQGGRPSPLRAGSLPLSAHGALRDRWPHPVDPRDPSGGPGTIPVTPETFPVAET